MSAVEAMDQRGSRRADGLFRDHQRRIFERTDRLFAGLLLFQWLAAITAALWISPRTWLGETASVHPHVWAAALLGAALVIVPVLLAALRPGGRLTRHVIAVAQMLFSALLIHLTGGRIETHFHVFGSLAFLAFYRDWQVLVTASAVVALDHWWRGVYWPQSVFGVVLASPWRWVEHAGWVIFEDVFLVVSCLQGVREMRQIAEDRAQVERSHDLLETARAAAVDGNRAKGEFLATMSHEIRTPLNGVVGLLDLLMGGVLTGEQRRYVKLARSAATLLTSVINDILDLSKIEAGKLEIVPATFNLRAAVTEIIDVMAQSAAKKGLEVACHIDPVVPALVVADCDRLRQILVNLLNNAIKFTRQGSVTVRLGPDRVTPERAVIRFSVTDTGIGIAPDRMGRLFKAFSQADSSTTRLYGGTGLGLVISKNLAELMGGTIGVESEPGRGSTFWFTIACQVPSGSGAPRPPVPTAPRGSKVMVVDDDEPERSAVRRQVEAWGFEAAAAPDGEAALAMLGMAASAAAPFDLVLIDWDMPGIDGFDLAQAIKRSPDLHRTAMVMLVSASDQVDPNCLGPLGFAGHTLKPARGSELFDVIMEALTTVGPWDRPARGTPEPGAGEQRAGPPNPGGARILVAEDNEINQIVATEVLTRSGFRCQVVPDGRQAVEAVGSGDYDLVLMDCQMPVMDGFEATRLIRQREQNGAAPRACLPIVALTANAMKGDRERCLEAGMDAYISKPIDPKVLLDTVNSLLATQQPRTQAA